MGPPWVLGASRRVPRATVVRRGSSSLVRQCVRLDKREVGPPTIDAGRKTQDQRRRLTPRALCTASVRSILCCLRKGRGRTFDSGFTALIPVELTQQRAVLVIGPTTSRENHAAKLAMMTSCCCGASRAPLLLSLSFLLSLSLSLFSLVPSLPPPPQ